MLELAATRMCLAHHHAHGNTSIDRIWTRISLSLGDHTHQLTHEHIKLVESTDRATDRFPQGKQERHCGETLLAYRRIDEPQRDDAS